MKQLLYCFLFILVVFSCHKPADIYNQLGQGAYLTFVNAKTLVSATDAASSAQLKVRSTGAAVASVNIYISAAPTTDSTQWKLIKNVPFNDSATLTVSNGEMATALGLTPGNLPAGVQYNLYNQVITKDGHHYSSANTNANDLENQLAFNTAMKWKATIVCAYNAATIAGTYAVVQDDWQDWQPGDSVTVTQGPQPNQVDLSQVWPNPAFANIITPLVLSVDPATGAVTVPVLTFGDYGAYKASSVGGSGFIFSCKDRISILVHIDGGAAGDQGNNQLILQK